jgi:hypothetical protein
LWAIHQGIYIYISSSSSSGSRKLGRFDEWPLDTTEIEDLIRFELVPSEHDDNKIVTSDWNISCEASKAVAFSMVSHSPSVSFPAFRVEILGHM